MSEERPRSGGADLWVFGYGSLIWRPDFPFAERRPAVLRDFTRRFYQGSTDHRGVPGAPGRVVTLVREPAARCWGVAYRIAEEHGRDTLARLLVREQGGYERLDVTLELEDGGTLPALVFWASPSNPDYLGEAPLELIAAQIAASRGPSGQNAEYVLRLAEALRELGAVDPHVFELEALVVELGSAQTRWG